MFVCGIEPAAAKCAFSLYYNKQHHSLTFNVGTLCKNVINITDAVCFLHK